MPPKKAASSSAPIYIVVSGTSIDSVHASIESANGRVSEAKTEGLTAPKVEVQTLIGGSVNVDPVKEEKPAKKAAPVKEEKEKPAAAPKKTKTPAEQRESNAEKPKGAVDEADLPENYKTLLAGEGSALKGLAICVTGVPPTMGRKNAEKLVTSYGGKVAKSLSKNTNYVVVGNEAGPKKLEQIENLGIETLDEDGLVSLIEGGGGSKRAADDDEDEDEKPAKKSKKKA